MVHRATCEGEIEEGTDLGNILVTGLRTREVHLCVATKLITTAHLCLPHHKRFKGGSHRSVYPMKDEAVSNGGQSLPGLLN